jgi:hypothetical protein
MIRIGTVTLTVMLVGFSAAAAHADVVELKNGQRIEGALKQADQATVTVEVGGQIVTFKAEQVRAIYYGSAPAQSTPTTNVSGATPATNAAGAALTALKALNSAVGGGLSIRDYGPRFTDAKIVVDQYLSMPANGDDAIRTPIRESLGFYALAKDVWTDGSIEGVGSNPLLEQCPPIQKLLQADLERDRARIDPKTKKPFPPKNGPMSSFDKGLVIGVRKDESLPSFWSCASAKIAAADKAISQGR